LFLNAVPHSTTTNGAFSSRTDWITRLRSPARISSGPIGSPARYYSSSLSSCSLTFSTSFSWNSFASASMSAGMSATT